MSVFQSDLNKQFNFYPDKISQLIDGHIIKESCKQFNIEFIFIQRTKNVQSSKHLGEHFQYKAEDVMIMKEPI